MAYKTISTEFQVKETGDGRTLSGYASTFGPPADQVGDIVDPGAFKRTIKKQGPPKTRIKLFWLHREPLGRVTILKEDSKGLFFEGTISRTQLGDDAIELIRDRVVDKMSIGYREIKGAEDEDGINHIKEAKLFELSPVPFPANERADNFGLKDFENGPHTNPQAIARSLIALLGLEKRDFDGLYLPETPETKAVVSYQNFPLADINREWDAAAAKDRVRSWADADDGPNAQYRRAFVWYDKENEDIFGSYKLPITDVINGELFAIPRGIFAAANSVNRAPGSPRAVDIPSAERDGVKNHLARYYGKMRREFDRPDLIAPWDREESSDSIVLETLVEQIVELGKQVETLAETFNEESAAPVETSEPETATVNPLKVASERAAQINAMLKHEGA
jgi:HK97 family phage prohead protease